MTWRDHYGKEKNKKVIRVMKDWLGGKIRKEFVRLRPKIYIYLIYDGNGGTRKSENKINHLEKHNLNVDNLWQNHKNIHKIQYTNIKNTANISNWKACF